MRFPSRGVAATLILSFVLTVVPPAAADTLVCVAEGLVQATCTFDCPPYPARVRYEATAQASTLPPQLFGLFACGDTTHTSCSQVNVRSTSPRCDSTVLASGGGLGVCHASGVVFVTVACWLVG